MFSRTIICEAKKMKIALATSDGKFVSRHFGNSPYFVIAEADSKKWTFIERRENNPACGEGGHEHERFTESAKIINDCGAVICSRIGGFAQNGLRTMGIQPLEKAGFIEDLLDGYVQYLARTEKKKEGKHPCFDNGAHARYGRIHLPVSAQCNIKCRFCERNINDYELSPGVSKGILKPEQAVETVAKARELCPELAVIGIAGPGDPLADNAAIETFRLLADKSPSLSKCISTNGLNLPDKARELWDAGVKHLTITVNVVDPKIGEKIISHITLNDETITGTQAAELLLARQLEGIRAAVELGMELKVNTVLISGINDGHIAEIAKTVSLLGVKRHNIMPLIPRGEFAGMAPPDCVMLDAARTQAGSYLTVFRHCAHCRADACGIPGLNDFSRKLYEGAANFRCNNNCG
jgi:nitrogen fixation protein NifB